MALLMLFQIEIRTMPGIITSTLEYSKSFTRVIGVKLGILAGARMRAKPLQRSNWICPRRTRGLSNNEVLLLRRIQNQYLFFFVIMCFGMRHICFRLLGGSGRGEISGYMSSGEGWGWCFCFMRR